MSTCLTESIELRGQEYGLVGEDIIGLLSERGAVAELQRGLEALDREHGARVYSELLYLLAHLDFEPEQARECWNAILALHRSLSERMGAPPDIRVALVSYFVDVSRQLENPKVIELRLFQETQNSVFVDELTGLFNYRYFRKHLTREMDRSNRDASPLSLVMLDVDDFKHFNDHHGHHQGNQALVAVAEVLRAALPESDVAIRYGGEEFALVLPSTLKDEAGRLADRVREGVEGHTLSWNGGRLSGGLTVSAGVATYPADATDAESLVAAADQAMYQAKSCGKNQVCLYGESHRSHPRVAVAMTGELRGMEEISHTVTTVNLSEGGLMLLCDHELRPGELVEIELALEKIICICGRVLRSNQEADGLWRAAVKTQFLSPEDRALLAAYLRQRRGPEV